MRGRGRDVRPPRGRRLRRFPLLHPEPGGADLRDLPGPRCTGGAAMSHAQRITAFKAAAEKRILVLDGSWGVLLQKKGLVETDFRGERFKDHPLPIKGDYDALCLTRPDLITEVHDAYFDAG